MVRTPLLEAIDRGDLAEVQAILAGGSGAAGTPDSYGRSAVLYAATSRLSSPAILEAVLRAIGTGDEAAGERRAALQAVLRVGRVGMVRVLAPDKPLSENLARGVQWVELLPHQGPWSARLYPHLPTPLYIERTAPRAHESYWQLTAGDALEKHRRVLRSADLRWLIPCLEKMAAGAEVPLSEIAEAHLDHFHLYPRLCVWEDGWRGPVFVREPA